MDNVSQLAFKSQTVCGGIHFCLFLISWPTIIGLLEDFHDKDRLTFNCVPKPSDVTKQLCYGNYTSTVSPLLIPLNFAYITCSSSGILWIVFIISSVVALRRIKSEHNRRKKERLSKRFTWTFLIHVCAQLFVHGTMMVLFCHFQTIRLPVLYMCSQRNITHIPSSQVKNITCNDLHYRQKSKLNIGIITVTSISIVLCIAAIIHWHFTRERFLQQMIGAQEGDDAQGIDLLDVPNPGKEIIDGIRQLYKSREGWLAPFPWCEDFHFHLDDIFTNLKVVSRTKTRGTETTDTVDMSGIFKPHEECSQPRTVLIEGKPGMGKTTYCEKLVYDWATKRKPADKCFPKFGTVLQLRCRDMKSNLWEAIDDQLLPRDVKEDVREKFFDFIRQNQSNVLLILDGLDEVPANKLPMFSEIVQGRVLPNCRLLATARHEAGIKVRIHCDTLLEIEGFTIEEARNFIVKYFKTMEHLAQMLLDKLEDDEDLKEMAANPLNTALLCLFCEEFQGVFPESRTKLYSEIVHCVLRRYIQKKGLSENEDLIETYKTQLKHLGRIALNGLREDNLGFEGSELGNHSADLPGFGFLSVQPGGSKLRPRPRYAFLHKSFQEFFAAFYLCCQLLDKEITPDSLAADRRYFQERKEVLKFTFGMLAARCDEMATALVKSTTTQVNNEDHDERFSVVLECINECKKEHNEFHLTLARDSGSLLTLQTLVLKKVSDFEVVVLAEELKWNSSLTELHLSYSNIGDAGATVLAEALRQNSSLTKLYLSGNDIGDAGAAGLAEALRQNSSLTKLNLSDNNIGVAGATVLAEALNSSVTELYLSDNKIGDAGAAGLAKVLRQSSSMTELYLSLNNIGDAGAAGMAEALRQNSNLTGLYLSYNNIGDAGAVGLAEALRQNSSLTGLYLSYNNIGDAGAVGLAEALRQNSSLTELYLSYNNIGDAGAVGLAEALRQNSSLTELYLSYNNIGDAGAVGLAEVLRQNSNLTELYLSYNNIGDAGAAGLAKALRQNSSAKVEFFSPNLLKQR